MQLDFHFLNDELCTFYIDKNQRVSDNKAVCIIEGVPYNLKALVITEGLSENKMKIHSLQHDHVLRLFICGRCIILPLTFLSPPHI